MWEYIDDEIVLKDKDGSIIIQIEKEEEKYVAVVYNSNLETNFLRVLFRWRVEAETLESIRFNAPLTFTTQNRAVTSEDYSAIIKKEFSNVDSISTWGG